MDYAKRAKPMVTKQRIADLYPQTIHRVSLKYIGLYSYFLMRKEAVIVTCLDQVNIITQPELEHKCNQDIDYCEINISRTNSHYIDPNCSSLRERRI